MASECGLEVSQLVIVARTVLLPVIIFGQIARTLQQARVRRREHTALPGGDHLGGVKREHRHHPDAPHGPAAICGAQSLGAILDDRQPQGGQGIQVGGHPHHVRYNERTRSPAAGPVCRVGLDIPRARIDVNARRGGAHVVNGIEDCGAHPRGQDHLVSRSDPQGGERQMQCARSRRRGDGSRGANGLRQLALERRDLLSRGQPAGCQHL